MFEPLAEAIDELNIPVDGPAIVRVFALRDLLDAALADVLERFNANQVYEIDGATSLTAWLRDHARRARRDAVRWTTLARRLAGLPITATAFADGTLSEGQIDAIVRTIDDDTTARFADDEAELIPFLAPLTVDDTARAMAIWQMRATADGVEPPPERRELHVVPVGTRYAVHGDLDSEAGQLLTTALRIADSRDVDGEQRTPGQHRADALIDICRFFLDHQQTRPGGRHRPHINIVADLDKIDTAVPAAFTDGLPIPSEALRRLLCDCAIHRVITEGRSAILDYGMATRTIPAPLWNALVIRDERCRFPGCDRTAHWCEAHHVVAWVDGGPTVITNLVLCCSRHHHVLHQPGWHAKLKPDGTLEVTSPSGRVRTSHPPRTLMTGRDTGMKQFGAPEIITPPAYDGIEVRRPRGGSSSRLAGRHADRTATLRAD